MQRVVPGLMIATFVAACVGCVDRLLPSVPPYRSHPKTMASTCLSNEKQLALAGLLYAMDWDEHLPPDDYWCDATYPYAMNWYVYTCPANPSGIAGYGLNEKVAGVALGEVTHPAEVCLYFEASTCTPNFSGGAADLCRPARHGAAPNRVNSFAFVDGHAKHLTNADARARVKWEPTPGAATSPSPEPKPAGSGSGDHGGQAPAGE